MAQKLDDKPNGVYDDGEPAWRTNLSGDSDLEDTFAAPSAEDDDLPEGHHSSRSKKSTPAELKNAESGAGSQSKTGAEEEESTSLSDGDNQVGSGFKQEKLSFVSRTKNKFKGLSKKKKIALVGGGAAAAGFLIVILVLLSLLTSLKIVHVAENLSVYNLERSARTFSKTTSDVTEETIAAQEMDSTGYRALSDRFGSLKGATWDRLFANNPNKILENLKADGRLRYVYEDGGPRTFLPGNRKVLTGVEIDGNFVELNDKKFFDLSGNHFERIRFAADMQAALDDSLGGVRSSVRSKVGDLILEERGIKLRFWTKNGAEYDGLSELAAQRLAQKETFDRVNAPNTENCLVTDACGAASEANDDVKKVVDDAASDTESDVTAREEANLAAKESVDTITNSTEGDFLRKVVGGTSIVYSVAVPACLIFDGSIQNSKSTIDNRDKALQRTYFAVRTAADQQKASDTTLGAIGGFNDKLGNIDDANVLRRARGETVDTTKETSPLSQPQAGGNGTYVSALDLIFGSSDNLSAINDVLEHGCGFITDIRTGAALALGELALGIFSGGSSEATEQSAKTAIGQFLEKISATWTETKIYQIAADQGVSASAKYILSSLGSYAKRITLETGAIVGVSELLKLAVVQHMNATQNGLETDEAFVNQADMGANLYGNTLNRQMMYGRPMTRPEVAQSRLADEVAIAQDNSKQSVYQRYLAVSNSSSLITKFGLSFSGTLHGLWARPGQVIGSFLGSISLRGLGSFITNTLPFSRYASAATQASGAGDYNIVQSGWTEEEQATIDAHPELYKPLVNALTVEQSGKKSDIESKYGTCFTSTMGELLADEKIKRNEDGTIIADQGLCSPNNLGINNNEFGPQMVFRYRLMMKNQTMLDFLNNIQNPSEDSGTQQSPGGTGFVWPVSKDVQNMVISQCYTFNGTSGHPGLDISNSGGIRGKPVLAAADGSVSFAGYAEGYGPNFVAITHNNGFGTSYGHMDSMSVKVGDKVVAGQQIGTVGSQGMSSGPHLHFNMFPGAYSGNDGPNVDPLQNGLSIPDYVGNPNGCT